MYDLFFQNTQLLYVVIWKKTLAGAAVKPGHALTVAKNRKMAAHHASCVNAGVSFVPLPVEALGGWGPEAIESLEKINKYMELRSGHVQSNKRHLFERLSVTLQRGNASLIIRRTPTTLSSTDGII